MSQRDENLSKADAAYTRYQNASTATEAIDERLETSKFHNSAKAWESTANVGLILGILFAWTSYEAFQGPPDESRLMLLSLRGMGLRIHF